jgi:hypothetical protein
MPATRHGSRPRSNGGGATKPEAQSCVLARVRKTNPTAYLRIVAALCPVRLDVETHQQLGEKTEEELLEDIVRDLDKLGVLPMIAAKYEQSCITLGPQSNQRRQLPGVTVDVHPAPSSRITEIDR